MSLELPKALQPAEGAPSDEELLGPDPNAPGPRLVVDAAWLARLLPEGGAPTELDAAGWKKALLYAGLLPILQRQAEPGPSPVLTSRLQALREALAALEAVEAKSASTRALLPETRHLDDGLVAFLAGLGLFCLLVGFPIGAALSLVGVLVVLGIKRLALQVRGPGGAEVEKAARLRLTRALRGFLHQTWVEPLGEAIMESAPAAELLRQRMVELDRTLRLARARLAELEHLQQEIRGLNEGLGQGPEDAETRRVEQQRSLLANQIRQVELLRERFAEQLSSFEGHLDRMRALARRRLLSQRVSEAIDAEGNESALAEAEVEAAEINAIADSLGREVAEAELRLKAMLETAAVGR